MRRVILSLAIIAVILSSPVYAQTNRVQSLSPDAANSAPYPTTGLQAIGPPTQRSDSGIRTPPRPPYRAGSGYDPPYQRTYPRNQTSLGESRGPTVSAQAAPPFGVSPGQRHPSRPGSASRGRLIEPAQVIGVVGDQSILAGDVEADVIEFREQLEKSVSDEQFAAQRPELMKAMLKQRIDTMLVYHDFLRKIPPERLNDLMAKIDDHFNEKVLPSKLDDHSVETVPELEAVLRRSGLSLQRLRRSFAEKSIAHQMISQSVKQEEEITHQEMLDYYWKHIEEYEFPAKVQWEEVMTEFRHYKTEAAAYRELAIMGNEVLRGAPLHAVAQRSQQGPRWEKGGLHEWTSQGSLRSKQLDDALFSFPIGKLSPIIRDDDGFHIIRILRRDEAGRTPFTEAQVEIKEKIRKQRRRQKLNAYVAELREQTPIWTIFDNVDPADRFSSAPPHSPNQPR